MYFEMQFQVWWPSFWTDICSHYLYCAACMPLFKRVPHPGISIIAAERFRVCVYDVKILPKVIAMSRAQ